MEYSLEMNRHLGTKWFTFYTRVRPWLACLTSLTVVLDFLQYMSTYFSNWWLLLYFIGSIAQAGLSIAVAVKSDDAYADFVRFVKGVLLFETINMAYGQGVQRYLQNGLNLEYAAILFVIVLVINYFVWYRLNVKYFEKRLMRVEDIKAEPERIDAAAKEKPAEPEYSEKDAVPVTTAINITTQQTEPEKHPCSSFAIDEEQGLVPNKPIYLTGTDYQSHYLRCLHSINGETLNWNHRGSVSIEGVQGLVEIYDAYLSSGIEYRTIYLSTNGGTHQTVAPKGFSYVSIPYVKPLASPPAKSKNSFSGKKTAKVMLIIATVVIVLAVCVLLATPEIKYREACSTLKEGAYASAIQKFEDLDGYKNSEEKIHEAMYSYVQENKNNSDTTTFDYLKKLKKQDYKDSGRIYENLYAWEITVIAVNSSENDETTDKSTISRSDPVYFHIELTGGEPSASVRVTVRPQYPNGETGEYIFDNKWTDGQAGWYGWYSGIYEDPEYGATGTLRCKFYDDDGNLIGMGSVQITE